MGPERACTIVRDQMVELKGGGTAGLRLKRATPGQQNMVHRVLRREEVERRMQNGELHAEENNSVGKNNRSVSILYDITVKFYHHTIHPGRTVGRLKAAVKRYAYSIDQ